MVGSIASGVAALSEAFGGSHSSDNAFWQRKYIYGYTYNLNQTKELVTQFYYEDYGKIPEAYYCEESELA